MSKLSASILHSWPLHHQLFSTLASCVSILGRRTLSRLPSKLTDDWLKTLPLVKQPLDSVHYTGRQLQIALKQLRLVMDRDDPIEEYKVGSRDDDNIYFIILTPGEECEGNAIGFISLYVCLYAALFRKRQNSMRIVINFFTRRKLCSHNLCEN